MFTDHRVIFAIVDQMKIRKRHEKLYKKMYDLTWFYTSRLAYTLDCPVVYYDSVDEALENCQEYDTVIMQSVGNLIQENEYFVTSQSTNLISELRKYAWDKDKRTGETLNKPIDDFNHAIDSWRYHEMMTLGAFKKGNSIRIRV
jgi:hypothetical protein